MTGTRSQTVLVLGGGVGGLVAARELRRKLPDEHRIVLVDRDPQYVYDPSLLWLMTGLRTPEKISRPREGLADKGITVLSGDVESIDPESRRVTVGDQVLEGDHLVIALGADQDPAAIPGLGAAGHDFYSLGGAEDLRDARATFRSGRLVVLTAAPAYKCPAAPYEAALLLEYDCRKRKIRDDVSIDLFAAEPGPMGVAGPDVSAGVRDMVESKEIGYHPDHQVARVDPDARRIHFTNGAEADFDLLAFVPPHRAPAVVRAAGLTDDSGWIPVDRHSLATGHPDVYAVGDVTTIPLAIGKPLPMAGVFAHAQAEVVADNIGRGVTGRGRPSSFDGHGECFIEAGDGKAGFGRGDFFAEPVPEVRLYNPGRHWHAAKVVLEKELLREWF